MFTKIMRVTIASLVAIILSLVVMRVEAQTPPTITADKTNLLRGECTIIRITVPSGWTSVSFDGLSVPLPQPGNAFQSSSRVCPQSTTTYQMHVRFPTWFYDKAVTVSVSAPPPPTSIPPTVPPPPTRVPLTAPPPTQLPSPSINFYADPPTINLGDCSTLRWEVENVRAVFWGAEGVAGHDSRVVCPRTSTVYVLRVITYSGEVLRTVAVNVRELPPTQAYIPPTVPSPTAYVLPTQVYIPPTTPLPTAYIPPTSQPIAPVPLQNPSNVSSKQEDNSTVFNQENAGGLLLILGGIALVLRPIIKWLWPGN